MFASAVDELLFDDTLLVGNAEEKPLVDAQTANDSENAITPVQTEDRDSDPELEAAATWRDIHKLSSSRSKLKKPAGANPNQRKFSKRLTTLARLGIVERPPTFGEMVSTSIRIPLCGFTLRIYLHYWVWQIPILFLNIALFLWWYFTRYSDRNNVSLTELGLLAVLPVTLAVLLRDNYFKWFVYWCVKKSENCFCTTQTGRYHLTRLADCIGGLHASLGITAFIWNTVYVIDDATNENRKFSSARFVTAFVLPFLLATICISAIPPIRYSHHNAFEFIHRYFGWIALCVLVSHVCLVNIDEWDNITSLASQSPVILTIILLFLTVYPWIIMHRIPSSECEFYYGETSVLIVLPVWCRTGAICKMSYDWREYHVFGITPVPGKEKQSLILIQGLGDWTNYFVAQCKAGNCPKTFYLHRIFAPNFTQGLFNFKRVFIVVTGSGIAPILPYALTPFPDMAVRLVWIARDHVKNYPPKLFELVSDLPPDMVELYDTRKQGRPNLPKLALKGAIKFKAEAVFIVSRASLAYQVCDFCNRNGMLAFGSNFDV